MFRFSLLNILLRLRSLPLLGRLLDQPWLPKLARILAWGAVAGYFVFGLLLLGLRYLVLPQIDNYRGDIETALARAVNRPVAIRHITGDWRGLHPLLTIEGFEIRDNDGRPVLGFEQVEAELGWSSLLHFQPRLAQLVIEAPNLAIRREKNGHFFVAGLEIDPTKTEQPGFADWLLTQDRVVIREARISWHDELRAAPPLELAHLNFRLDNNGHRHRFGLTVSPPPQLAERLELRGDLRERGDNRLLPEAWRGSLYAEADGADLAGWQAWFDYPLKLATGRGGLRLWLDVARRQVTALTADVRLADLRLQLADDLPTLALHSLDGRIKAQRDAEDTANFKVETRHLALVTEEGWSLPATDFSLAWQKVGAGETADVTGNRLDLDTLTHLAAYLPLPPAARESLLRHAPRGLVLDYSARWARSGDPDKTQASPQWSIKGRFENLGGNDIGPLARVTHLSGKIEGSDQGGTLSLAGKNSIIELPEIFTQPQLGFDTLTALVDWKAAADGLHVNLRQASFRNADASGEASGRWHGQGDGPGEIDLTARLSQARGDAVWRYMPRVVGQDTRDWLHSSILDGVASEASLRLKGDLRRFPFRGGKDGLFEVRGRFHGARLRYASAWPEITGIDGELLFSGERMLITGHKGRIFGVDLANVKAEIADLESLNEQLTVSGMASGPTADFLRFIEASPVGERIDHFTKDMKAAGNGTLHLDLHLPLRQLSHATVAGRYHLDGNRLTVDSDLPPLGAVSGEIGFTTDHLEAHGIRATLLETPLLVDIKTAGDGQVQVDATGEVGITTLRRQFSHPLLDNLSGSFKWSGTVQARKKTAAVRITSNLVGLASSLPAPFNKTTTAPLALNFERRPVDTALRPAKNVGASKTAGNTRPATAPVTQDQIDLTLGRVARLQLQRRRDGDVQQIGRGLLTIGAASASLPERGILIAIDLPRIDGNSWRRLLASGGQSEAGVTLPELQFDLRTPTLTLFDQEAHDVRLTGSRVSTAAPLRLALKSRELTGNFEWIGMGRGKLLARLDKFALPDTATAPETLQARADALVDDLPALDLAIGELSFRNRSLGSLRLTAENSDSAWHTRLQLSNGDGELNAEAQWRPRPTQTRVNFKLTAKSLEKMLERIGHPGVIRRGNGNLNGQLSWQGPPFRISYPTLEGKFELAAGNGQFNRLEPGVGRLLGILSLQSLPRRITLDFRDIFSEGFAFDAISGQFAVRHGVMETSDLQIRGPAAKILMNGAVDLVAETQQLKVRVQPALGESMAVGAMLANPVAGAIAYAAQKILKDPLDQAFAYEYRISGGWADPKVEKLGSKPPGEAPSQETK